MTDAAGAAPKAAASEAPRPRLGPGLIFTKVLAIFFKRLPKILLLCLPAAAAMGGMFWVGIEWLNRGGSGPLALLPEWLWNPFTIFSIAIGLGMGLAAAPLSAAFHSYQKKGRVPLGACLKALKSKPLVALVIGVIVTGATLLPFAALSWATSARLGLFIGSVALVIGMYALGLWGLALPAISRDQLGFRGFRRSMSLSQGYRWPIAGTCFVLFFTAILAGGLVGAGVMMLGRIILIELLDINGFGLFGPGADIFELLAFLDFCLSFTIIVAIIVLGLAAIRARMAEIKEPPDIEDMVDIFD